MTNHNNVEINGQTTAPETAHEEPKKKGVSGFTKFTLGCGGFLIVAGLAGWGVYSFMKTYNNRYNFAEQQIMLQDKRMETVHAEIFQVLKSKGAITEDSADKVLEAIRLNMDAPIPAGSVQAGSFGSLAVTRESMKFDTKFYEELMQNVDKHQKEFKDAQMKKLKYVAQYKLMLNNIPDRWIAPMLGYPSKELNLAEMDKVISSAASKKAWQTKEADLMSPIDPKSRQVYTPQSNHEQPAVPEKKATPHATMPVPMPAEEGHTTKRK